MTSAEDGNCLSGHSFGIIFFVFLFLLCSCSGPNEPSGHLPSSTSHSFHIIPTWYDENILLFENIGVVEFGYDWVQIQEASAGVVKWDFLAETSELFVPTGISPSANLNQAFSCFVIDESGTIALGDINGWIVIEEDVSWGLRVNLKINSSGSLLAWVALSSNPEKGIWILDTTTMEYTFVGLGFSPAWHTVEDKLLYRSEYFDQKAIVATYDFSTGVTDTISSFPTLGGRGFAYSPSGDQIAYFGFGSELNEFGVYVFDVTSGEAQQINQHSGTGLCWGARGIVYSNECGDMDDLGCGVLWIINTETWESQQLTDRFQFVSLEEKSFSLK